VVENLRFDPSASASKDAFATLTFTYDSGGNEITAATSGPGTGQPSVTLTSGYNPQHSLTSVADNISGNAGLTTYSYDAGQRLSAITTSYNGTAGPQIVTGYAANSQISSQSRTIGGSGTAVNSTMQYDAADRQTTITDYVSGGAALATYIYTYDNGNRITSEKDAEGTASFTYDNSNELMGVTGSRTESYAYDGNGNRTGAGYSTTVMNEIATSPGVITYTYDSAGNTTSANSGGTFTTYTYDYRNRLTGVKQGGTVIATYVYDALDRRIEIQDSGGSTTWTIYNGTSPDAMPYGDFNSSGTLLTRYTTGPGTVNGAVVDELIARTTSGGTSAWYLTDNLDSVRDVVNSSGSAIDHVVYDGFGNITTETNAANGDRFKFASMEYEPLVKQSYDHARWYAPTVGRFVRPDPIALAGGDPDLYRYVNNDVTDHFDPSGKVPPQIVPPELYRLLGDLANLVGSFFFPTDPKPPTAPVSTDVGTARMKDVNTLLRETASGTDAIDWAENSTYTLKLVQGIYYYKVAPFGVPFVTEQDDGLTTVGREMYIALSQKAIDAAATVCHEVRHARGGE
jgi:RHS repeat-associated protein